MPQPSLRIISDLHYAEPGCRIRKLSALAPLFDGAAHLLLNGDSIETRFLDIAPRTREHKHELEAFVAAQRGRVSLLTGNHDPDVCDRHFLELADGRVLVTHGDVIFPDMCPWGWEAKYYRAEQERQLALMPAEIRHTFEAKLRASRATVMAIRDLSPRFPGKSSHPWRRRLRFLMTIRRVDRIIHSWHTAPDRAALMAETYRPRARVVIFGHTHCAGRWERRGRIVINTGSAVPPMGALAVDFVEGRIELRPLVFGRDDVRVGPVRSTVELDALPRERAAVVAAGQ